MNRPLNIGIIADFNAQNLVSLLTKRAAALDATVQAAPFGQVIQTLADPSANFWKQRYDALIVWTLPASVSASFARVIELSGWSADDLNRDVDTFAAHIRQIGDRAASVLIPTWSEPLFGVHRASLQMQAQVGMAGALMHMNLRLSDAL